MERINLLEETIAIIKRNGYDPEVDVSFVTDGENYSTWSDFTQNANFSYNPGYGGNEVNLALKVVGKDWWLERHEYDGSEWWEFKKLPVIEGEHKKDLKIRE